MRERKSYGELWRGSTQEHPLAPFIVWMDCGVRAELSRASSSPQSSNTTKMSSKSNKSRCLVVHDVAWCSHRRLNGQMVWLHAADSERIHDLLNPAIKHPYSQCQANSNLRKTPQSPSRLSSSHPPRRHGYWSHPGTAMSTSTIPTLSLAASCYKSSSTGHQS